jgi:GTPase
MKPVLAIVGRPNVGKSTLFNRLTHGRDAIVADFAGLTRDRHYGDAKIDGREFIVVDTGGFEPDTSDGILREMAKQTRQAVAEADVVVFVLDARAGLSAQDHDIARYLRSCARRVLLAVNKAEGMSESPRLAEFHELGLGEPHPISAAHGQGIRSLIEAAFEGTPEPEAEPEQESDADKPVRLAVAGRPNVGKSTLMNRLLGEERVVASDQPGTTRDSIEVPFERGGKLYMLIDTAGIRRRARVEEQVEKDSIVQTMRAIEDANVVVAVLDAREGVTEHDAALIGIAVERGRALVVALNKWDGISGDQRELALRTTDLKLPFVTYAPVLHISALHGTGVGELMQAVAKAWAAAIRDMPTTELTRILESAIVQHQPPLVGGRRIKLRYAHQGGRNPPLIVIHGNQTVAVPAAYRRYLENVYRDAFDLMGTPVKVEFRTGNNPYKGRRNPLTARQVKSRQRLKRHVRK